MRWVAASSLCAQLFSLPLASLPLVVSPASAAPPAAASSERADALFREGRRQIELRRFEEARRLFELSYELDPSPGTLFNIGRCLEEEGDLVRALATTERALADARASRDPVKRQRWIEGGTPRRDALLERTPVLVLMPSPTPAARVEVDDQVIERVGEPMRLNPGKHQLEVSAPGKRSHTQQFEIQARRELQIALPALEDEPVASVPAPSPTDPVSSAVPDPNAYGPRSTVSSSNTLPWVFVGTGATLGAASIVTALIASSRESQLDASCEQQRNAEGLRPCTDPGLEEVQSSGQAWATTTYVLWALAGVSAGVGITLFLIDDTTQLQGGCFGGGCGLNATGTF